MLLVQVDLSALSEEAVRLLCRTLADYACPAVQVHGDQVFHAPYRTGSGSYLTAHGNTWRHSFMADNVIDCLHSRGAKRKRSTCGSSTFSATTFEDWSCAMRRPSRSTRPLMTSLVPSQLPPLPPIFGKSNQGESLEFQQR